MGRSTRPNLVRSDRVNGGVGRVEGHDQKARGDDPIIDGSCDEVGEVEEEFKEGFRELVGEL